MSDKFKKNFEKLKKPTYQIDSIEGFPSFTNKWQLIHSDATLALIKYFKKKYKIEGDATRMKKSMDSTGAEKHVRASAVYSAYNIIRKAVLYSKYKNPERPARILQYGNKFFPVDREDLHLLAVDLIKQEKLLGPAKVINLSGANQDDFGNILGSSTRNERVFKFLGVPAANNPNKNPEGKDASGKKLTKKQLDLFNRDPDKNSADIGFKDAASAKAGIKNLANKEFAHQSRAAQLMIRRAEGALARVKEPEKRKNLKQALSIWKTYESQLRKKGKK